MAVLADYLRELSASDCSPLTIRSYAFDLMSWFWFLATEQTEWGQATRATERHS